MLLSFSPRLRQRTICALLAMAVCPFAAAADDMVPVDVVLELLKVAPRFGAVDTSLIVGAAPGELSELLALPDDFEISASLVWKDGSSIIGRSELSESQLIGQLEAGLIELGWSRYRKPASASGFQPSLDDSAVVFCREEGDGLAVEIESKGAEETGARLKYQAGTGFSSCQKSMARYERMEEMFGGDVPFPTLYPPEGSKSQGSGGGTAGDFERTAQTYLDGDLTPADVLLHYASQLGRQGWQPDARVEYESLAYQSWLFLDESGKEWHGLLLVKTSPRDETKLEVELEVNYLGQS